MNPVAGVTPHLQAAFSSAGAKGGQNQQNDPKAVAKQVETIFLNEIMKVMLEQTSIGKDKTVSTYLPLFTSEIARSFAERGVGVGEFVLRGPVK